MIIKKPVFTSLFLSDTTALDEFSYISPCKLRYSYRINYTIRDIVIFQVLVGANVTQQTNDKQQLEPMVETIKKNIGGAKPQKLSADTGYFSQLNMEYLEEEGIDAYVATGRNKHSKLPEPPPLGRIPKEATKLEQMSRKLRTKKGRETYSKRKEIVEPVFGQIKEGRGFRRFLLRGLENVMAEWDLICLTHNLLKVFRSGLMPKGE